MSQNDVISSAKTDVHARPKFFITLTVIFGWHFIKPFHNFSLGNPNLKGVFHFQTISPANITATDFDFP